ncbi:MAG: MATE family efflux transporter [Clostridia bacterium]|nr:MATE family efflux transporter [Clostridia bacterium]
MLNKYIGNKSFYKNVLKLAIPIMLQNAITSFVNMLDNIMVGKLSTNEMTGVAVANQLIFVFTFCIFGAVAGAGIFGAQFFGKGDHEGVRYTFRFKLIIGMIVAVMGIAIFWFLGNPLINLYLKGEGSSADKLEILSYAKNYLNIMLIGLIPFTISQCYSATLRECDRSLLPMFAGIIAVAVNLIFNFGLIYGKLGFPELRSEGAAIATVISRFTELLILVVVTALTAKRSPFIKGAFKSLYMPYKLSKEIFKKGMPLMLNEILWASGMAAMSQCYSIKGIDVVAGNNIAQTYFNVFSVAFTAVGISIGIILGQQLGKGSKNEVLDTARKLITFSLIISFVAGALYFVCASFIPELYNTSDTVRHIAKRLMQIGAITLPLEAFAQASYFTLRSGGKTFIVFLFDSAFMWFISIPVAFVLGRYSGLTISWIYLICQLLISLKCILGYIFVKRGIWIKNIVDDL